MVGRYLDFERENGNRDLYVNLPITSILLNVSNKSLFSLRSPNRQTDKKVNYFRPVDFSVCNKGQSLERKCKTWALDGSAEYTSGSRARQSAWHGTYAQYIFIE